MKAEEKNLDPEVMAILREIAAQPGSTLLEVPRRSVGGLPGFREDRISSNAPFLSRAERHLLDLYRDELADLLLEAVRQRFALASIVDTHIHLGNAMDPREFKARILSLQSARFRTSVHEEELANLDRHLKLSPSQLARASARVVPTARSRIAFALAEIREGNVQDANRILSAVLAKKQSAPIRANALANQAFGSFTRGAIEESANLYGQAASLDESHAEYAVYFLTCSLLVGNVDGSRRALSILEGALEADAVVECHAILNSVEWDGRSASTARKVWQKMESRASANTRSLIDGLF